MEIKQNLSNRANYGSRRDPSQISFIVIHYTGNDGDSDEANCNYFKGDRGVSAHYFVDDNSISRSVPDDFVAWSVGGKKYSDCNKTGGGSFYNICKNSNSISIELCDSRKNGVFDFTENTLKQAAELTKALMKKYDIESSHVIRHFDVTGKICPLPFVRSSQAWLDFKKRLSAQTEDKLFESVRKIIRSGISLEFDRWKREDLINLNNVPELLSRLGGLQKLIDEGIIIEKEKWLKNRIKASDVKSLLIKYAARL